MKARLIPLWLPLAYTAFALVLLPVYVVEHGLPNFLWFSNIAFLGTLVVLWLQHRLLASMLAVGVLLPELMWNLGFFTQLLTGISLFGLTDYMFERENPLFVRALSLYHVPLPVLLAWLVHRLGYDRRAPFWQFGLAVPVLLASYLFGTPDNNINFAQGPGDEGQTLMPQGLYLALLIAAYGGLVLYPSHWLLRRWLLAAPRAGHRGALARWRRRVSEEAKARTAESPFQEAVREMDMFLDGSLLHVDTKALDSGAVRLGLSLYGIGAARRLAQVHGLDQDDCLRLVRHSLRSLGIPDERLAAVLQAAEQPEGRETLDEGLRTMDEWLAKDVNALLRLTELTKEWQYGG